MSNDPFNQPGQQGSANPLSPNSGGYGNPSGPSMPGQSPYGAGDQPPPTKKKGRACLWIAGIFSGLGVITLLLCCGGFYFLMGTFFDSLKQDLNSMAGMQSEFGTVEDMSFNFGATVSEAENNPETLVFDVESADGKSAQVAIKLNDESMAQDVILISPNGERTPIDTTRQPIRFDPNPAEPNPANLELGDGEGEPLDNSGTSGQANPSGRSAVDSTERELDELEAALDIK